MGSTTDSKEKSTVNKEQIRVLISNIYDLQKMRISAGNRLVQSFYLQMGVEPSTSPDDAAKDEKSMIDKLRAEYKRISDAVAKSGKTAKTAIKELNKEENPLNLIRNENDAKLVESYEYLLRAEEESIKVLEKQVKQHPMWDAFFKDVKGCGPLMSGICLAYLDPYKARHVSCFFRYAGLDTVQDTDKDGNKLFWAVDNDNKLVAQVFTDDGDCQYVDCETGEVYDGEVMVACHGRRKGDTEMQNYYIYKDGEKVIATDEDGNPLLKRGITYNPKLKTKLMGVLAGCLLKAKDSEYKDIYYDYRTRLDNSPKHKDKSKGQKHMMAQRYMIKEFLRALWIAWRTEEGLEVDEPYEVAKLGNKPHKYNQYQCDVAKGSKAI